MFYVRTVRTGSHATAVQVIRYEDRKRIIVKHIGSAHNEEHLNSLKHTAQEWIDRATKQQYLFPSEKKEVLRLIPIDKLHNLGFRYSFAYETISKIIEILQLTQLRNHLFLDLVVIRVIQPASKLESLKLLSELFGISYQRADFYRAIPVMISLKEIVEKKMIAVAKEQFAFDFSIVFYDVTTLYFETFTEDENTEKENGLRKKGFSKDDKSKQPQIVIGIIVTREGFPVFYDVFEGNIFEGKTFIPSISKFKKTHEVKNLTVVADAAMLSLSNIKSLIEENLSYIVGARVGNLNLEQIKEVNKALGGIDGASTRIETERGKLICDFSLNRFKKDKREMEQQMQKADYLINHPSKIKRNKFLKKAGNSSYVFNTQLIEKTKLLLGIRGYYTNLIDETNKTIISHYHNLWHIEQAFRIAKSDLVMRPIYHFKKQAIEVHILICFIALAICKYMELKTGRSTKAIVKLMKQITDARIFNTITDEEIIIRSDLSEEVLQLLKSLSLSH